MSKKFKLKPVQQIINKQTGMSKKKDIINEIIEELTKDDTKYMFLEIAVQDGEREHNHRVLFETKCKSIDFAICYYLAHYWGFDYWEGTSIFAHGGEIALKVKKYKQLTKLQYDTIYNVFYG